MHIQSLFGYSGMRDRTEVGCMWAKQPRHCPDCGMERVFVVDFDFVAVIGGFEEEAVGAFASEIAGLLGDEF